MFDSLRVYLKKGIKSRKWTDQQLMAAVSDNVSMSATLRQIGLTINPHNYSTIYKYIKILNLNTSHWTGRPSFHRKDPSKYFVVNSTAFRGSLKQKIKKENLLPFDKCQICGISEWLGKPLPLRLDHINGVSNDNRLSNLRFICSNCDSLLPTYCRSNVDNKDKE